MNKIIYTRSDGGLSVIHPAEGFRLALKVTTKNGVFSLGAPVPVWMLLRPWPTSGALAEWAETEDEFIARISKKDVPADAVDVRIVPSNAIPADRSFRDAWSQNGGEVVHDMNKCRAIHRDRLRQLRAPKLAALDVEYTKALESGNQSLCSEIAAKKQALRDATADPRIDAAATPEALKSVLPAVLS